MKSCICKPGDPCDYHACTCIVCPGGKCQGHPNSGPTLRQRYEAAGAIGEFLRSFGDNNNRSIPDATGNT